MVATATDLPQVIALEGLDLHWGHDGGPILTGTVGDAGLAEVVHPPGPDGSGFVHGEAVVLPAADLDNFVVGQTPYLPGDKAVSDAAIDDAASQLILLPAAPGQNVTLLGESQGMVSPHGNVFDLLELGDQHGRGLDLDLFGEAKDALVVLYQLAVRPTSQRDQCNSL